MEVLKWGKDSTQRFGSFFFVSSWERASCRIETPKDKSGVATACLADHGCFSPWQMTQVAASCLKVPVSKVFISETATDKVFSPFSPCTLSPPLKRASLSLSWRGSWDQLILSFLDSMVPLWNRFPTRPRLPRR